MTPISTARLKTISVHHPYASLSVFAVKKVILFPIMYYILYIYILCMYYIYLIYIHIYI